MSGIDTRPDLVYLDPEIEQSHFLGMAEGDYQIADLLYALKDIKRQMELAEDVATREWAVGAATLIQHAATRRINAQHANNR